MPLLASFPMAAGAYFNAKKGARLFASKQFWRSEGVVMSIEGGPSRPELQTQTSSLPQELRMSSIRVRVACSSAEIKGYGIILHLGWVSLREEAMSEQSSLVVLVQA